jgi:type 1 glutamine amidotransferase
MEILDEADLVVLFARRRAFPADQMRHFHAYLKRGGPLVALRTACHAFDARGAGPQGHEEWARFDPEVLGGNYHGHHGNGPKTTVTAAAGAQDHPILARIKLPWFSNGSLYEVRPLTAGTNTLLIGTIPGQEPEPVAWTNHYGRSRVFFTSLGHPDDFDNPQFRKLLVNAIFWALD